MASVGFWSIAQETPERTAVISASGEEQTFGQLFERVNQISHGLRALGLKKGGAVAMIMSNVPEYLEVFLASQQIGVYITPINYHLTGPEIAYILDNCGAEVLVVGEKFGDAAKKAIDELGYDLSRCYSVGEIEGFKPYAELFEGQSGALPENRLAGQLMLYTSGTTGRPKGVRRPLEDNDPDATAMMSTLMGVRLGHVMDGLMVNVIANNGWRASSLGDNCQFIWVDSEFKCFCPLLFAPVTRRV